MPAVKQAEQAPAQPDPGVGGSTGQDLVADQPQRGIRVRRLLLVLAVLAVAGIAAASSAGRRAGSPPVAGSAGTPRRWFDAYMAAAVDDPGRVCRTLFTTQLAASYRRTPSGSCERYFADVQDTGVRIEQIVNARDTAVVELRQTHPPRYRWNAVLSHNARSWRAVAILDGR
jgi:hypothetical protein